MVDEFVRLGHTVFGCGRTTAQIEKLKRLYPRHDFQTVDVASDAQVKGWAERLLRTYGPPDFVLNNAAVINLKAPLWKVGEREISDEIDINIKGVVNVIRHFVPSMISRGQGVIVNFSSRWGGHFEKQMAPYCATKWALVALTRALAEELRTEGIAVVGLNPGIVKTGMLQRYLGDAIAPGTSKYPAPADWSRFAVPFILRLRLRDTGRIRTLRANFLRRSG
jgi:NAD(P)-dependent dehydrogenase (short-subunit alcohol dehydrogenase family)